MIDMQGKTVLITGASRGIGKAIALRAARAGANIVVAAKTSSPHPTLPGTIHETVDEVLRAGGKGLAVVMDVRDESQVGAGVQEAVRRFGGIDVLVNNASAIHIASTEDTPEKRYDLMFDINVRGTYVCSRACIPHLKRSQNPHILTLGPPLALNKRWFAQHTPYTVSKYAMTLMALGLAAELAPWGIASNTLWPATIIGTAALNLAKAGAAESSRTPEVMADAAFEMMARSSKEWTGQCHLDEEILRQSDVQDFGRYQTDRQLPPLPDLFVSAADSPSMVRLWG